MMRGPGCACGEFRALGRRRHQRLDQLMAKADDLVGAHIAADHALGEARLKRLIDDRAIGREIGLATGHERGELHFPERAPAPRLQHAHVIVRARRVRHELDLPHSLAAIAAVALEDARTGRSQPCRKLRHEFGGAAIEVRIGPPAEMPGVVQDLLDAHCEDRVGMGADPGPARGDLAQHRVEDGAGLALMDRIDPDEHPLRRQQLVAHLLGKILVENRGLGLNAARRQRREHLTKAIVCGGRGLPRRAVAAPDDRDPVSHVASSRACPEDVAKLGSEIGTMWAEADPRTHTSPGEWRSAWTNRRLTGCLPNPATTLPIPPPPGNPYRPAPATSTRTGDMLIGRLQGHDA